MTDVSSTRTKISLRLLLGITLLTSACSATQIPVAQSPAATQSPTATTSLQSPIPTAQSSTATQTSQAPVTQSSAATQSPTTTPSAPAPVPTTQSSTAVLTPQTPTEAPPATSVGPDTRNYLGVDVPGPNPGSTVTVYDFRSPEYNEVTDQSVAGIDAQVCVGELPEGTSQATWAPWSLIGPKNARYSELEPAGGVDMSPMYPQVTRVASGDCVRGWITFAVPADAEISGIRYILGEDAGNFAATFRPLPAPAPGQTRPEGCKLISDPNDEAASGVWLKPNQNIEFETRASYADPEEHGTYFVVRTTDGTVLTWWTYDREYQEKLNGPDAAFLPYPADAATFAVAEDFMKTGRLFRPSQGGAYEIAKQCVA